MLTASSREHSLPSLARRHPSLGALGIAVEYFPRYINRKIRLHSLDVVLLSFILRGCGTHTIDEDVFVENGSSLAVTHYGQKHDIQTGEDGMDVMNVYLDLQNHSLPVLPRDLAPVLPLLLPMHPKFQHRLNRIVRLHFDDPWPAANLLFAIRDELQERPAGYQEAVALQFKLFLMLCCRSVIKNGFVVDGSAAPPRPQIEELRQYLDRAFAEPHTLASLAERARLSRTSLCRAFKAYTGKRLFDYLIERRIQGAMLALRGSDEKILTVALNNGFCDLAYFNRKFKKLTGMTPTAYRGRVAA